MIDAYRLLDRKSFALWSCALTFSIAEDLGATKRIKTLKWYRKGRARTLLTLTDDLLAPSTAAPARMSSARTPSELGAYRFGIDRPAG